MKSIEPPFNDIIYLLVVCLHNFRKPVWVIKTEIPSAPEAARAKHQDRLSLAQTPAQNSRVLRDGTCGAHLCLRIVLQALEEPAWVQGSSLEQPRQSNGQTTPFLSVMGIGKNTTSKSMEAGSSTEGKYEDEAKHPAFFTLPDELSWGTGGTELEP
ncbi:hypothetical protein MC885_002204 [Smutsia gigantea]|nr:hypothetical protein MC885_002204 [Smutsia gigantea]